MFVKALEYAGIYCVVLLILLPAWMVWGGRYRRRIASTGEGFRVPGGKFLLGGLIVLSFALLLKSLI